MPFELDAFLADVLKNVPADKKQAFEEVIRHEAVSGEISKGYSRQDDYSRNMDKLSQQEKTLAQARQTLDAEKARYTDWWRDANVEYERATSALERYRQEYGDLEGNPNQQPRSNDVDLEGFQRRVAEEFEKRDRLAVDFADALTDAKLDYRERFGERLDVKALYSHVEESGLPFRAAYDDFVRPRVQEAEKAKHEEALKQAREEGLREGRASATLPVQPDHARVNALMETLDKPVNSDDRVAAAAAAWRAAHS